MYKFIKITFLIGIQPSTGAKICPLDTPVFGSVEPEQNYPLRFKTRKYSFEATGQVGHKGKKPID